MRGRVREIVIYFKFHENRSMGVEAVGGRKSPSSIDNAHGLGYTTACTTVQAVTRFFSVTLKFQAHVHCEKMNAVLFSVFVV